MNKIKGFLKNNLPLFLIGVVCVLLDKKMNVPSAIVIGAVIIGKAIINAFSRISIDLTLAKSQAWEDCPDKVEPQAEA